MLLGGWTRSQYPCGAFTVACSANCVHSLAAALRMTGWSWAEGLATSLRLTARRRDESWGEMALPPVGAVPGQPTARHNNNPAAIPPRVRESSDRTKAFCISLT